MKPVMKIATLFIVVLSGNAFGENTISFEELRKHNTDADCWMAIDGAVYDMSPYIQLHREKCKETKFSEHCGTDATSVWKGKESSSSPHKKKSQRGLTKAKVGTFSNR